MARPQPPTSNARAVPPVTVAPGAARRAAMPTRPRAVTLTRGWARAVTPARPHRSIHGSTRAARLRRTRGVIRGWPRDPDRTRGAVRSWIRGLTRARAVIPGWVPAVIAVPTGAVTAVPGHAPTVARTRAVTWSLGGAVGLAWPRILVSARRQPGSRRAVRGLRPGRASRGLTGSVIPAGAAGRTLGLGRAAAPGSVPAAVQDLDLAPGTTPPVIRGVAGEPTPAVVPARPPAASPRPGHVARPASPGTIGGAIPAPAV